ncbi:MAG TPA: amino acid adenylation domain-containing protein [Actinospica sp.]|jgi:amino acid adenylation domain-containing protein|nr:amino acid adenylation domain-containing protein [Actinospica sp.]
MPYDSLADLYEGIRAHRPSAVALADGRERLDYRRVGELADALAGRLAARGVGRGSLIGVEAGRSVRTPVAILGVLKAGAAYLPLDPGHPAERLRTMAQDAGIDLLIGGPELAAACGLDAARTEPVPMDLTGPITQPVGTPGRDDPAYVIYTSGSTGRPKGCVVSHGNVLSLLDAALPLFDVDERDRWSLFHSASFDFSVWELWGAWATGATAVVVPDRAALSAAAFIEVLTGERITVLNQVPSVFRAVASAYRQAGRPELDVRYLIFGGESVDLGVARRFVDDLPPGTRPVLVNMYGITETTVHATFKLLTEDDLAGPVRSPIGRPLGHLEIELREGEMWLSGPGVAAGYLNRPELTAERFVVDGDGGRRSYRSGDLARQLPDGGFEYLGRVDRQVKLRGFRVELGEVEAVLRGLDGVADAAVTVVTTGAGAQILAAALVPANPAQPPEARELRAGTAAVLPAHMVPSRYAFAAELPLTSSGKLDRAALPTVIGDPADHG